MDLPAHLREDDRASLLALMRAHSFATLITAPGGVFFASHVPLLVEDGEEVFPRSHLARANPQWRHFPDGDALAIFHGPHALIHPDWYASAPNLPTWNCAVVHASGPAHILEGGAAANVARRLVAPHTPDAAPLPAEFEARLLSGVVAFELRVARRSGKFKLGQNKSARDREHAVRHLERSSRQHERDAASLMRERG